MPVRLACALLGAALALLVSFPIGPVAGVTVAFGLPRVLAGLEPRAERARRERLEADLPLLLDLLAACLAGGATLPAAARAVATAVGGPGGERLAAVSSCLQVGMPVSAAWLALAGPADAGAGASGRGGVAVTGAPTWRSPSARRRAESGGQRSLGGVEEDPLAPAARALARAAEGGAAVARAVAQLAAEARAQDRSRAEQAARRVGVLAVAPLGLCFLPAFVLLGIVPVVVGLAEPLLGS